VTREEIIKGVKGCVGMYYGFRCGECPYGPYSSDCVESLHRDVERLMEAQTPRVMTFDELRVISGTDTTVFIENRKKPYYNEMAFVRVERVYGEEVSFSGQKSIFGAKRKGYAIEWRAWTSRPSAAQMKAEPWKAAPCSTPGDEMLRKAEWGIKH